MRNKYWGKGGTKASQHFLSIIIRTKAQISGVSLVHPGLPPCTRTFPGAAIIWEDSGLVALASAVPAWPLRVGRMPVTRSLSVVRACRNRLFGFFQNMNWERLDMLQNRSLV